MLQKEKEDMCGRMGRCMKGVGVMEDGMDGDPTSGLMAVPDIWVNGDGVNSMDLEP